MEANDETVHVAPTAFQVGVKPHRLQPGDMLDGGLEILEMIGQGGMGAVWKVHHREWNRDLAVKMPLPKLVGSPTARERFLREAETWIDLGVHPHIVQCWFVKDIAGLPSLFLDYLTGGSLKQWLVEGHLRPGQWKKIIKLTIQAAEGLDYAHSKGVVHRDIKPANLLIRGDERLCVTDFGIVKTANDETESPDPSTQHLPDDISLTGTGAFLGTPMYGAPEQWGGAAAVTASADIYALGITLYEMCCGRRPFDSDEMKAKPQTLIACHLEKPAPDPREFNSEIPTELAKLILLSLEKDPARRPKDMAQFKSGLCRIYERLGTKPYEGVGKVPQEQRADILNNIGVSLHSLAKQQEARKMWQMGLRIESGHAECLYNLTKLELRGGEIDGQEALRRLRQAKVGLALGLLCIEEGQAAEAVEVLESVDSEKLGVSEGTLKRALGDAQMYCQQYYAAEKAYRAALKVMPSDALSQERKRLASLGKRNYENRILFPSGGPAFRNVQGDPSVHLSIDGHSRGVVGFGSQHTLYWDIEEQSVSFRAERSAKAQAPIRVSCSRQLALCEEENAFELWQLPELKLLGRKSGSILQTSANLLKMLVKESKGYVLFEVANSRLKTLEPESANVELQLACFDPQGERLCVLLSDGSIAQPDEEGRLVAEDWPKAIESHSSTVSLALSQLGTILYCGHQDGRLLAYDFVAQEIQWDLKVASDLEQVQTCEGSNKLLIQSSDGFQILSSSGRSVLKGRGPATLHHQAGHVLGIVDDRLELYSLSPLRKLRSWSPFVDFPQEISVAQDGRRALSHHRGSHFEVWEIDEKNRVYERSFLLSPGKSFAEICKASETFRHSMDLAHAAQAKQDWNACSRHLKRSRSIEGYAQRPEAKELSWKLLSHFERDGLESVWERAVFETAFRRKLPLGPSTLTKDGARVLQSIGSRLGLLQDNGRELNLAWSLEFEQNVLALRLDHSEQSTTVVLPNGEIWLVDLEQGSKRKVTAIEVSVPLDSAHLSLDGLLFKAGAEIAYHSFESQKLVGRWTLPKPSAEVFPFQGKCALVSSDTEFYKLDLGSRRKSPQHIRLKGVENNSGVSFAMSDSELPLSYLGFRDGSVVILSGDHLTPVCLLQDAHGEISNFSLLAHFKVGMATTNTGRFIFWDVSDGSILEEFSAHRSGICLFQHSPDGRYLLSGDQDGLLRLWETSWSTSDSDRGKETIPWLQAGRKTGGSAIGRLFGFRRS